MIVPTISVETTGMEQLFRDLEQLSGKGAGQVLRERAGLLARICVDRTQPVVDAATGGQITVESESFSGVGQQAKKMGENAVTGDIAKIYASVKAVCGELKQRYGQKTSKAFFKMMQAGEFGKAENFIHDLSIKSARWAGAWDAGARHKQMRGSRGKVGGRTRAMVTPSAESLTAYVRKVKGHVGYTKSGWVSAALQIPGAKGFSKIPQWVKRHHAPGTGTDGTRSGIDPHIILTNGVPWIEKVFGGRQMSKALQGFDKIIAKDLIVQIQKLRQKHSRLLAA